MPALVSLTTVAVIELICQLPGSVSFFLTPLSLLGYVIAILATLVASVSCFIRRRTRRGVSLLLMLLVPFVLWSPIHLVADLVHLELTTRFGVGQIGVFAQSSNSNFEVYDWSVGLAGSNTFLIHDVTDEIAQHTQPSDSEDGFKKECAGKVRRLVKHYYVCYI